MMHEKQEFPRLGYPAYIDFATNVETCSPVQRLSPAALPDDKPVTVIQTHASAVLLAPERVYKLKNAKKLWF